MNLSEVNYSLLLSNLSFHLLRSEDDLGGGGTHLVTEVLPGTDLVVVDAGIDFSVDLDSVEEEVLTNVIGEGHWALEDRYHALESGPVSLGLGAVGHSVLDLLEEGGNIGQTINGSVNGVLFEIFDSFLSSSDKTSGILDAGRDIIETFSVEGTLEGTGDDLLHHLDVDGINV